ncbi:uncharacterized protein [Coffea arabica]|uniref:RNase H type-1 domain-containing protein n=1 Tax=Coffea arabica TaxID=13443 RepID=A0ABM4U5U0_COFAR
MVASDHIQVIVPLLVLWCIWHARNAARFKNSSRTADHVIWQVHCLVDQLAAAGMQPRASFRGDWDCTWAQGVLETSLLARPILVAWERPHVPSFKLNTDASVTPLGAYGGGLVRSHTGNLVFAFYKEFGDQDVLMAEASSLLLGLHFCQEWNFRGFGAEVDAKALVAIVSSNPVARWPLCNLIHQILALLLELGVHL